MTIPVPKLRHGLAVASVAAAAAAPQAAQARNTQRCFPSNTHGVATVIPLPHIADVRVTEQTCVIKFPVGHGLARYKAWVRTTWAPTGRGRSSGERFYRYTVQATLEFRLPAGDKVISHHNCAIANTIDAFVHSSNVCQTPLSRPFVGGNPERAFTGDGKIIYDIEFDGNGSRTMQLHGTPRV
jgi:hypothetical protein